MLQNNLCRIVEAYSSIEISQVAKLINLPQHEVELQLSKMILDKKLNGILDQGLGCLEIFEDVVEDQVYKGTIETIQHTSNVSIQHVFLSGSFSHTCLMRCPASTAEGEDWEERLQMVLAAARFTDTLVL